MRFSSKTSPIPRPVSRRGEVGVGDATTGTALGTPRDRGVGITACRGQSRAPVLAAAAAALALALGCNPYVQGNGVYNEETRTVNGPFVGIHIQDGVSAYITSGGAQSVKVSGDANLVPYIDTILESEMVGTTSTPVLHVWVDLSGGYSSTIPPQVAVSVPSFSYVRAEGSSPVQVKQASASVFTVKEKDSARVELIGTGGLDLIDATLTDDASLDATAYPTGGASVDLSGRSTAKLHSNGPVTGRVLNDAVLNNLLGTGDCAGVTASPSATVSCNP